MSSAGRFDLQSALRLIEIMVPARGHMITFAQAYFDETETPGERSVFAVAGLVLAREEAEAHAIEWAQMLRDHGDLPYLHMTDLIAMKGVHKGMTREETDLLARKAIAITRRASAYFCVSVETAVYDDAIGDMGYLGGPYAWCAISVLGLVAQWCEDNPSVEDVSYFFEDGAYGKGLAQDRIREFVNLPHWRAACRFGGDAYVPKSKTSGCQSADMLAWHSGQEVKRRRAGQERRRDFVALLEGKSIYGVHWTRDMVTQFAEAMNAEATAMGLSPEQRPQMHAQLRLHQASARSR